MKNKKNEVDTIDLLELWHVFTNRIIPIFLVAALCVAAMFAYSKYVMKPMYESTATLYILKQDNSSTKDYEQADYTLALNVINDCTYMITSQSVLSTVVDKLDLDMTCGKLKSLISTSNPSNTRVIEITVKTDDAVESKRIVDCVCSVAAGKIEDTLGMDSVNVYSKADLQRTPCNAFGIKTYALGAIAAALIVYVVYVVKFLLDDKIRTAEDVEKYLGLAVLGDIPNFSDSKSGKGKYYKYQHKDKKSQNSKKGGRTK